MERPLMTPDEFAHKLRELARTAHARPALNYDAMLFELEAGYRAALRERASVVAARVDVASRMSARQAISRAVELLRGAESSLGPIAGLLDPVDTDHTVNEQRDYFEARVVDLVQACMRAARAQIASGATTSEPATENAWDAQTQVDELVVEIERLYAESVFDPRRRPGV